MHSIGTSNIPKIIGVPPGINSENIWKPYFFIPIKLMPIKIDKLNVKVITIWLVNVKEYGNNPIKLTNKTKINKERTKG